MYSYVGRLSFKKIDRGIIRENLIWNLESVNAVLKIETIKSQYCYKLNENPKQGYDAINCQYEYMLLCPLLFVIVSCQ